MLVKRSTTQILEGQASREGNARDNHTIEYRCSTDTVDLRRPKAK